MASAFESKVVQAAEGTPVPSDGQILAVVTRSLVAVAQAEGLPQDELLAAAGLSPADLSDPDRLLPLRRHVALGWAVTERLGAVNGGLHSGAAIYGDPQGALGFAVRRSGRHDRALQRFCRYVAITNDGVRLELGESAEGVSLSAELAAGLAEMGHPNEALFAAWVSIARVATGVRWAPKRVEFRHAPRGPVSEHRDFFGCPVSFGASASRLVIDRAALALPIEATSHPFEQVLRELRERWVGAASMGTEPARERPEVLLLLDALAGGPLDARQDAGQAFAPALLERARELLRSGASPLPGFEIAFWLGLPRAPSGAPPA